MAGAFPHAFKDTVAGTQAAYALDASLGVSGIVPVGAIVAWTTHVIGTPSVLPDNWKLCDGTVINNFLSPMNGRNVPSLNGAGGTGHFLRGSDVSGSLQAEGTNLLAHVHDLNSHQHAAGTLKVGSAGVGNTAGTLTNTVSRTGATVLQTGEVAATGSTAAAVGNTAGPSTTSAETRPINMTVKWAMRIY